MPEMDKDTQINALKRRLDIQSQELKRLQIENDIYKETAIRSENVAIMSDALTRNTNQVIQKKLTELNKLLQEHGETIKSLKERLRKYEEVD